MNKLPATVVNFAAGNKDILKIYASFQDYWNHYRSMNSAQYGNKTFAYDQSKSFDEKESLMNAALRSEIVRVSGVQNFVDFPVEQWASNPMISWATFAVVNAMIDSVLPTSLIDSIGIYSDIRVIGWGDNATFDIEPRDLFTVTKAGRAQKVSEANKQFKTTVALFPEMHMITVQVSLMRVLAGLESLASFVAKATRSIESQITIDAYTSFSNAMNNLDNAGDDALRIAGFSATTLTTLCQKVEAWNGGAKPMIIGTQLALNNILPADANYRYFLNDSYVTIGYLKDFMGYSTLVMPQVAAVATPFTLALADNRLYVVSTSYNKLVKVVMEGSTVSNVDSTFQNANLTQNATLWKSWVTGVVTNAVAGCVELS